MGSFSAERSSILSSLGNYTEIMRSRKEALIAVQALSDRLLEMVASGNFDDLMDVVDQREKACVLMSKTMAENPELARLLVKARELTSKVAPEEPAGAVLSLDADIRAILTDILDKQQKCEDLLRSEIAKISEQLKQSAQSRKLNLAYGPANARPQSRFLDSTR